MSASDRVEHHHDVGILVDEVESVAQVRENEVAVNFDHLPHAGQRACGESLHLHHTVERDVRVIEDEFGYIKIGNPGKV